jgi:hypothetical protein
MAHGPSPKAEAVRSLRLTLLVESRGGGGARGARPQCRHWGPFNAQACVVAEPHRGLFSKFARSVLRHIRVTSKHELKQRIMAGIDDVNRHRGVGAGNTGGPLRRSDRGDNLVCER